MRAALAEAHEALDKMEGLIVQVRSAFGLLECMAESPHQVEQAECNLALASRSRRSCKGCGSGLEKNQTATDA